MKQNNFNILFCLFFLSLWSSSALPTFAQRLDISNQPLSANSPLSGTRQLSLNQKTKLIQMDASIVLAFKKFLKAIEKESIKAYQPLMRAIPLVKSKKGTKAEFITLLGQVQGDIKKLEEALRAYEIYKNLNPSLHTSISLTHKDWIQILVFRQEALALQKLYITSNKPKYLAEKKTQTLKAKALVKKASERLNKTLKGIKTEAERLKRILKVKALKEQKQK
ncbi:MAG: hypothetical protein QNL04_15365 [SAR324 cluster bacterium]|nr:hypothetical protein [SAR324 cluster bacterium]